MLYCERCHTLFDDACPLCGKHTGTEPRESDLCFITEQSDLWSGVLEDVLQQAAIPFVRKQYVGVAPLVGANLGRYRFFVPFPRYEEAMELCAEVFSPVDDLAEEDGEMPDEV